MRRALVVGAAVAAGCIFPSVSDLGGDDGGDAIVPSEAAADAPIDAPADSAIDAGFDCAAHTFCDDFSTGEAVGAKWNGFSANEVTFSLDTAAFTSPPSALLAVIPPIDGGSPGGVLSLKIPASPSTPHLAFAWDMRIDALDSNETNDEVNVFQFATVDPDLAYYDLDFYVQPSAWLVSPSGEKPDGGIVSGSNAQVPPLATGTWRHVNMDVIAGANASWALAFDGAPVASGQLPSLVNATQFQASFGVVGTYLPNGTVGVSLRFDNFTFDALAQ